MTTLVCMVAAMVLAQADDRMSPASPDVPTDPPAAPTDTAPVEVEPSGTSQPSGYLVDPIRADILKVSTKLDPHPPADRRRWGEGEARGFVSSTIDAGYLYLRPRLSLGYGLPHFEWIGIDLNPIFQNTGYGAWGGIRAQLPWADLRVGARHFYEFTYNYLAPQDSYSRVDLDTSNKGHASYNTFEAELTGGVSLGFAEIQGLASISYVTGVPQGMFVFEQNLRVLIDPPWIYRGRLQVGFYPVPGHRNVILGPVVDVLDVPKRGEVLVRSGLTVRVVLSRAFEMRGNFVPSVASKDNLGFVHSDFTELGLRYRWASGEDDK